MLQSTAVQAARVVEALRAAGYRPAVCRHARLPAFLGAPADAPVLAEQLILRPCTTRHTHSTRS